MSRGPWAAASAGTRARLPVPAPADLAGSRHHTGPVSPSRSPRSRGSGTRLLLLICPWFSLLFSSIINEVFLKTPAYFWICCKKSWLGAALKGECWVSAGTGICSEYTAAPSQEAKRRNEFASTDPRKRDAVCSADCVCVQPGLKEQQNSDPYNGVDECRRDCA